MSDVGGDDISNYSIYLIAQSLRVTETVVSPLLTLSRVRENSKNKSILKCRIVQKTVKARVVASSIICPLDNRFCGGGGDVFITICVAMANHHHHRTRTGHGIPWYLPI